MLRATDSRLESAISGWYLLSGVLAGVGRTQDPAGALVPRREVAFAGSSAAIVVERTRELAAACFLMGDRAGEAMVDDSIVEAVALFAEWGNWCERFRGDVTEEEGDGVLAMDVRFAEMRADLRGENGSQLSLKPPSLGVGGEWIREGGGGVDGAA